MRRPWSPSAQEKMSTTDTDIGAYNRTSRMLDTGTRVEWVILIVSANSMVDGESSLPAPAGAECMVYVEAECLETISVFLRYEHGAHRKERRIL